MTANTEIWRALAEPMQHFVDAAALQKSVPKRPTQRVGDEP